jgi:hypothetical protein
MRVGSRESFAYHSVMQKEVVLDFEEGFLVEVAL